jgi:predicted dehydrogenase
VEFAGLWNRTRSKAEELSREFGGAPVYGTPEELVEKGQPDFIDIITGVDTHPGFVRLAAKRGVPVVCQKPMAPSLAEAEEMVRVCRSAGVPLWIHENWRWQHPIREFARALRDPALGGCFRARVSFSNSFPVFDNQPFLRELEQFILTDIGSHVLDTARFLFGEARSLYCRTARVNPSIRGEDVATVMMEMGQGTTVTCEMSYASRLENERFPQTFIVAECGKGSVELGPDYRLKVTDGRGTRAESVVPPHYPWADPAYDVVHASIVACNRDILSALRREAAGETTGEDNLRTVRLVFGAYESAASGRTVTP